MHCTGLRSIYSQVLINNSFSREINIKYSVLQGSTAGANIFNLYCSILSKIVPSDWQLSDFTDDHSVRKEFSASSRQAERSTVEDLQSCMIPIKNWMDAVQLKMNPSKTEFTLFDNQVQLNKCETKDINVNGDLIVISNEIRYLGAWMDANLNYKLHVTKKCQAAVLHFQKIKSIRHLLDPKTCASLCISLCISHLDYANSLLIGLPEATINKLQWVQNMCAKLALRKGRYDSLSECMKQLHWLPIKYRIVFKILVLTCKCLNGDAPQYLKDLIVPLKPNREGLRSGSLSMLLIPKTKCKMFAIWSFSVAGPTLWNSLPEHLKLRTNVQSFKKELKTYLFIKAYQCYLILG